ncbi:MAG: lasso peptide isopeptide bond-forming cyclase [Acidobacteriia bacterium]|nr:lasso peptide isopeptide bond-forming cyclase [Terriglobia bacterium]
MSAIFGIVYFDGKPVERKVLAAMEESLAPRGPDGRGTWLKGPVGLGHRLLWVTPESLHEKQPLANADGTLVITADARVDNRDELIAELGTGGKARESLTDVELILRAYERWGEPCAEKLLGDFAFVIWDERRQQLYCVRDCVGVNPFYYYHRPGRFFAFASEIGALFQVPGVPRELNDAMVATYLLQDFNNRITFYKDVLRSPPAHTLTVAATGVTSRQYWELDPGRAITLSSEEAYAERLREIFTEAVQCRLRSAFPVGSYLSGGLDSSSIVCFARQMLQQAGGPALHTFSRIYENFPEADEREYIQEVLAGGGVVPHSVAVDSLNLFEDLDRLLRDVEEPLWTQALLVYPPLEQVARDCGVRVLLDGDDGDNAVGYGDDLILEHLRTGHWISAWRKMMQFATVSRFPRWLMFKGYVHLALPHPLITAWRRLKRTWDATPHTLIDRAFAQRAGINLELWPPRLKQVPLNRPVMSQWQNLTANAVALSFEIVGKHAARLGLECRYPFWDKRLLEYCLAVPATQKFQKGWNRVVMRRAAAGIVPDKIRWRGTKANPSRFLAHAVLSCGQDLLEDVIYGSPSILEEYVDVEGLRTLYAECLSGSTTKFNLLWKTANLGLWLRYTGLHLGCSSANSIDDKLAPTAEEEHQQ